MLRQKIIEKKNYMLVLFLNILNNLIMNFLYMFISATII